MCNYADSIVSADDVEQWWERVGLLSYTGSSLKGLKKNVGFYVTVISEIMRKTTEKEQLE